MTPPLRQKIEEIFDTFDIANADTSASYEEVRKQAVEEILKVVEGIVPDRTPDSFEEGCWEPEWGQGYNACRKEILKKLK